jgi:hypothetical protein
MSISANKVYRFNAIPIKNAILIKISVEGGGYSSVVEHLPNIYKS